MANTREPAADPRLPAPGRTPRPRSAQTGSGVPPRGGRTPLPAVWHRLRPAPGPPPAAPADADWPGGGGAAASRLLSRVGGAGPSPFRGGRGCAGSSSGVGGSWAGPIPGGGGRARPLRGGRGPTGGLSGWAGPCRPPSGWAGRVPGGPSRGGRGLGVGVASSQAAPGALVPGGSRACHAAGARGRPGRSAAAGLTGPGAGAGAGAGGVRDARAGLAAARRPRYGRQGVQQPHPEKGPFNRGQRGRRLLVAPGDCGERGSGEGDAGRGGRWPERSVWEAGEIM